MQPLKVFVAQKQGTGADGGTFQLDGDRLENDLPKMGVVGLWSHKSKPMVKDLSFPFLLVTQVVVVVPFVWYTSFPHIRVFRVRTH